MHTVIDIILAGRSDAYRVHEDADEALARYLAQEEAGGRP